MKIRTVWQKHRIVTKFKGVTIECHKMSPAFKSLVQNYVHLLRLDFARNASHSYVWHNSLICVTQLTDICDTTHLYVWHDSQQIRRNNDPYRHQFGLTRVTHMCAMTPSYVCHDSLICVPWLTHMCAMTHSYVCHDSLVCVPWLTHMCDMTHSYACHESLIYVTWLGDTSHSHVWHDSFICVTWLIHIWDTTSSKFVVLMTLIDINFVWHDSLIRVPRLNYMRAMTHLYVCHESFTYVTWLTSKLVAIMTLMGINLVWRNTQTCARTHSCVCHDSLRCVTTLTRRFIVIMTLIGINSVYMTHLYVCHDSFICVPWLIHIRDMTHQRIHRGQEPHRLLQNTWCQESLCTSRERSQGLHTYTDKRCAYIYRHTLIQTNINTYIHAYLYRYTWGAAYKYN